MSFATLTGPFRKQEPVKGGYNIMDGLQTWRQALAYSKGTRGLVGSGGVDVLFLGDSILHGSGSTYFHVDRMVNRLRQLLQTRFNPTDAPGGYGFLPIIGSPTAASVNWSDFSGGQWIKGSSSAWGKYGPSTIVGVAGASKGICLRHNRVNADIVATVTATWAFVKDMQVQHQKQLNSSAQNLTQRQCQIVYSTNSGDGNFRFDFGPFASMPYSSAQTGAVTVNPNAAESVGQRSTIINVESTGSATNYIQVTQLTANSPINIEGAILYCDDYDQGVRCHDLSIGGAKSADWNDAVTLAGLGRFGTGQDQSRNAKLVVIGLGTNDCGNGASPTVDLATYRANLTSLIQGIQGWASKPSVLLWYPPCQNSSNAENRWRDYIQAGRQLCDTYGCALLDFWEKTGFASHGGNAGGGYMFDRGFYSDGIHYADKGQDWMAHETFGALTVGL